MMVENENWVIELEEIPAYIQKDELESLKGTCQINFTWEVIIKWNGVFFPSARRSNALIRAYICIGEQLGGSKMNLLSFSN